MKYYIEFPHVNPRHDFKELANIEAALKILDHNAAIFSNLDMPADYDLRLIILFPGDFTIQVLAPNLPENENHWEYTDFEILDPRYRLEDREQRRKVLVRLGIIKLAGNFLHLTPPWGSCAESGRRKYFIIIGIKGFQSPKLLKN